MTAVHHAEILSRRLAVARGDAPADLLVRDVRLVNVLSGEIHPADVAVYDGYVVGFGPREARRVIEGGGRYLCPGLIDGHIHIESTLLRPSEFARAAAPHGACAVICDPHEIANVMGRAGIAYMLEASKDLPLTIYAMVSSCVPATDMETSGATLDADDIRELLAAYPDRLLGLAEVMNFPGVISGDPAMLAKLEAASGRVIDGHAPMVSGRALDAYILAGPRSDHECTRMDEALEKLRKGLHIMVREGSTERNLVELAQLVTDACNDRFSLVRDDLDPGELHASGHLDCLIRKAVELGVPPLTAVRMASYNTARYFRLYDRGAVAPGFRADFILLNSLRKFEISECYLAGTNVRDIDFDLYKLPPPAPCMNVAAPLEAALFRIPAVPGRLTRVIGIVPGQIVTEDQRQPPTVREGLAVADPDRDLAKLAVIERHKGTGNVGLGFVSGLGLKAGAIAGSMAHDSHNIITAGVDDADMALAARTLVACGGGFCVVRDGQVMALVELPIAGLMSRKPLDALLIDLSALGRAARDLAGLGPDADYHPFMNMSFLSLAVIPSLKLTDKGLVDVTRFEMVPLWVNE